MDEIERLRSEVDMLKADRKKAEVEKHQDRIESRKLPPMSQMTRMQKRYFLEPWMTVLTLACGVIAAVGFIFACFTPWHVEFASFGGLFVLMGAGFLITKMNFMEWNSRSEGQVQNARRDYDR